MEKFLPKGVNIVLPILAIGHNRHNFKEPYQFRPERFEAAERTEANAFDNVPFSAGPRNCIGSVIILVIFDISNTRILRLQVKSSL